MNLTIYFLVSNFIVPEKQKTDQFEVYLDLLGRLLLLRRVALSSLSLQPPCLCMARATTP